MIQLQNDGLTLIADYRLIEKYIKNHKSKFDVNKNFRISGNAKLLSYVCFGNDIYVTDKYVRSRILIPICLAELIWNEFNYSAFGFQSLQKRLCKTETWNEICSPIINNKRNSEFYWNKLWQLQIRLDFSAVAIIILFFGIRKRRTM